MSDFDDYVVMHLFRIPREYKSLKLTFKALLFDFIGGYLLLIFTSLYAMQVSNDVFRVSFDAFISEGYLSLIIALFSIAIFVPLMEELMFRGFVLDLASEAYGKWAAIFISAVLFALIHPLYILTVLNAFWAGLIYGYLRISTNSLWPPILLHSLWNGHIVLLTFYS
jgi:membrane protease YdiL (CAAX protease family)